MKQYASQFDEHPIKLHRNEAVGLPKDAGYYNNAGKVRKGEVHSSRSQPAHIQANFSQRWKEVITSSIALESYEDFRAAINKDLGRKFT